MARKKTKITLLEFKAWLSGIEELSSDDWSPDESQWKLIRDKIENIVLPKEPTTPEPIHTPARPPKKVVPATSLPVGVTPPPQIPGGIPDPSMVTMTPEAEELLKGKTPNSESGTPSQFV